MSTSWIIVAVTVTVQASPGVKSIALSSVYVRLSTDEDTAGERKPDGHAIENASTSALTASLKTTVTVAFVATPVSPFAGVVEVTVGPTSGGGVPHGAAAVAELRGAGSPAVKSAAFESVSVQPCSARTAAVEAASVGAGAVSEKFALPYPTRSRISAVCAAEQGVELPLHASEVACWMSATFPAVALMAIAPEASVGGSGAPTAPATVPSPTSR